MTAPTNERDYSFDAFFISLRTHFNFFRRFFSYFISFTTLFTRALASFFQSLPFLTPITNIASHIFDSLSFGSNRNNPRISNIIAILGYTTLITLGITSLFIPTLFNPMIVPAISLLLGLYFEGVTILNWFSNYKKLSNEIKQGNDVPDRSIRNARTMFYAAVITFISIFSKIFALSISATFPAAAVVIFVIAQITEITAVFGSLGKEVVNIDRNINYLSPPATTEAVEKALEDTSTKQLPTAEATVLVEPIKNTDMLPELDCPTAINQVIENESKDSTKLISEKIPSTFELKPKLVFEPMNPINPTPNIFYSDKELFEDRKEPYYDCYNEFILDIARS